MQRQMVMLVAAACFFLFPATPTFAEIKTIAVTGEFRMGDNDTRADAKRLALQDAKRLALEKAGTYIESITEVKNFQISRDELRAYTAGIVEVMEQVTKSTMEGETTVMRVDVTCRIDTDVVARQIDSLRMNEGAKMELVDLREERNRLRQELEEKNREMATLKSKSAIEAVAQERQRILTRDDVNGLLAQARVAFGAVEGGGRLVGTTTVEEREHTKTLLKRALDLDPSNPQAHGLMGTVLYHEKKFEEAEREYLITLRFDPRNVKGHTGLAIVFGQRGYLDAAILELKMALAIDPNYGLAHVNMGTALELKGRRAEAAQEYREGLRLIQDVPANRPLIEDTKKEGDYQTSGTGFVRALRSN